MLSPLLLFLFQSQLRHLACQDSLLELQALVDEVVALLLVRQVEQPKSVLQQLLLQIHIKKTFSCKTGCVIDLDQPGLQFRVDHHVKAQDLKAERILVILRLTRFVDMSNLRLPGDQGLDDQLVYFVLYFLHIVPLLSHDFVDFFKTSFVTLSSTLRRLVRNIA